VASSTASESFIYYSFCFLHHSAHSLTHSNSLAGQYTTPNSPCIIFQYLVLTPSLPHSLTPSLPHSLNMSTEPPAVQDLLTHILENGGSFNKVQLKYSATEGYSVFATHSLTQGEVAISVPYSLCLSLDSILKGPLSVILDSCPDILTYPDEVLAMALMCKAYSPDSVQAKHIASLPKSFNTPIFWSEEELNSLKGSMVWNLTNMMKKQIESDWNSIHAPLGE
jgi:hypothetical protein